MSRLSQVLDEGSSTGAALTEIYESLGIALYDSSGQMRSMYDILGDLAGKWNTLDTNTQQYIALTSAGSNQLNNFLALMNNFSHATEATETALNSAGSAARENSAYMESLDKTGHTTLIAGTSVNLSLLIVIAIYTKSKSNVGGSKKKINWKIRNQFPIILC